MSAPQPRERNGRFAGVDRTEAPPLGLSVLDAEFRNELADAAVSQADHALAQARRLPVLSDERNELMGEVRGFCAAVEVLRGDSGVYSRMVDGQYRHIRARADGDIDVATVREHLEFVGQRSVRGPAFRRGVRTATDLVLSAVERA